MVEWLLPLKKYNPKAYHSIVKRNYDKFRIHFEEQPTLSWNNYEKIEVELAAIFTLEERHQLVAGAFDRRCQSMNGDTDMDNICAFLKEVENKDLALRMKLNSFLPKPHAFVKNVGIEIDPAYAFNNSPFAHDEDTNNSFFVGRTRNLKKFQKLLESKNKKGVFLVTGFRGMGKTSFVNKSIKNYESTLLEQKQKVKAKVINLNLAQRDPSETDILKLMVSHLDEYYKSIHPGKKPKALLLLRWALLAGLVAFLITLGILLKPRVDNLLLPAVKADTSVHKATTGQQQDRTGQGSTLYKNQSNASFNLAVVAVRADTPIHEAMADRGSEITGIQKKNRVNQNLNALDKSNKSDEGSSGSYGTLVLYFIALWILVVGALLIVTSKNFYHRKEKAGDIIHQLYKRCFSLSSVEKGSQNEISIETINTKISGPYEREILNYPIASSKEIEYELNRFLQKVKDRGEIEFIFVFDELDKIEPAAVTADYFETNSKNEDQNSNAYLQQMRQRKQSVINIIAGLKNFLTTAPARFIFIAGREMFDATLADVADRQSSISSIFNYVFYIESFLKENLDQENLKSSLSSCIECYLIYVIFGKKVTEANDKTLSDLLHEQFEENLKKVEEAISKTEKDLEDCKDSDNKNKIAYLEREIKRQNRAVTKMKNGYWKSMIVLQNFIVYLTYRSNGSPKKIIKLIQEFIRISSFYQLDKPNNFILSGQQSNPGKEKAFLFFGFDDQYRIGFINHLYRPFIVRHGQSFNKFSDNIILSTTYLFDHLLKFHAFAFSLPNLELTPEVLSTNKTPLLREHILTIIEYLSNNHLRETEIGIFDYKFYSRTQSELIYISKTFESESAAFNFTLDEGYLIKLHIRNELKNLRDIHSKYNAGEKSSMSISHLNGILGDLHFFDQEYDDAIVAYSDCIRLIETSGSINIETFVNTIRFKLKLGLTLEKVKSYDEALTFYADAAKNAIAYFDINPHPGQSIINELLQIVNQGFLAMMVLQEKMGIDGISLLGVMDIIVKFRKLSSVAEKAGTGSALINANLYLVTGNLVYFKNNKKQFDRERFDRSDNNDSRIKKLAEGLAWAGNMGHCHSMSFYYFGLLELIGKPVDDHTLENKNWMHHFFSRNVTILQDAYFDLSKTKNENKYIAMFLSHIGDCLLSQLKNTAPNGETWTYNVHKVTDIFNTDFEGQNFEKALLDSCPDKVSVSDVLRCYFWAGMFFNKRGRGVSYSFQFRKILYVLHIVLKGEGTFSNEEAESMEEDHSFLKFLERLILKPILDVASKTAEHSDRHMLEKFKKSKFYQNNQANQPAFDIILNNNISNHPDTREALSLFIYIRIKVKKETNFKDYMRYRQFISPTNSFATQYTRIYELNFWSKLNLSMYQQTCKELDALNQKTKSEGATRSADQIADAKQKLEEARNNHRLSLYMYAFDYLHAQFSRLLMIDIYTPDYTVSQSLKGFIHFNIANFIDNWHKDSIISAAQFIKFLSVHIGFNPLGAMEDRVYHYSMAISHMKKAKQLHSQGQEYRKNMDSLIYLEDDINDNAYHFGAAVDRYMMTNKVFDEIIEQSKQKINQHKFDISESNSDDTGKIFEEFRDGQKWKISDNYF